MSRQLINKEVPVTAKRTAAELQTLRKKNLRTLIKQWDGPTKLAKELRYTGPSYLSQMIGPNKPITETTARGIEDVLSLAPGWMDMDHTAQPVEPVENRVYADTTLINDVMVSVMAVLGNTASVPPCLPGLVSLAYEHAAAHGRVDADYIDRLVKLTVRE